MCQQPLNGGFYYKSKIPKTERPLSKIKQTKIFERRAERQILWSVRYSYLHSLRSATFNLWHFLTLLLVFSRLSLLLLVPVSAFGVLSTFWKVTVTTTPVQMLMCDKVTPQYDRQPPLLFRTKGHSIRRVHDFMLYLKY